MHATNQNFFLREEKRIMNERKFLPSAPCWKEKKEMQARSYRPIYGGLSIVCVWLVSCLVALLTHLIGAFPPYLPTYLPRLLYLFILIHSINCQYVVYVAPFLSTCTILIVICKVFRCVYINICFK